MTILVTIVLLLLLCLALGLGLLSVLQDLVEQSPQDAPIVHDSGAIFHDQVADSRDARSQFAWRSRSHSRAPD